MKQRKKLLFALSSLTTIVMFLFSTTALGQSLSVKGRVVDKQEEPIIGASVLVEGTSNGTVTDLNGDFTYYKYRIVQCDANWNPSSLNELEYLEGFNDQEIRDYAYSVNTRVVYTQYVFSFPNDLVGVTKSGNYLIHVYKEEDNSPVITRRFVVSDQMFGISAEIVGDLRAGSVPLADVHRAAG